MSVGAYPAVASLKARLDQDVEARSADAQQAAEIALRQAAKSDGGSSDESDALELREARARLAEVEALLAAKVRAAADEDVPRDQLRAAVARAEDLVARSRGHPEEPRARELLAEAGFGDVTVNDVEGDLFNSYYIAARP